MIINILVPIDRKLAQIAITQANVQGDHPGIMAEVFEELAQGDAITNSVSLVKIQIHSH